jgi:hypothetical protein
MNLFGMASNRVWEEKIKVGTIYAYTTNKGTDSVMNRFALIFN